jgi:secreted PhoX family phosphatase
MSRRSPIHDFLTRQHPRRSVLKGGLGAALTSFLGCAPLTLALGRPPLPGFKPVPPAMAKDFDTVVVPEGYTARPFFSWGDAVEEGATPWQGDATEDGAAQKRQAGQGHDGMWFFPFPDAPNRHGLLAVNHEHLQPVFLHPMGPTMTPDGKRPRAEVEKEQAAHGISIIEIRTNEKGEWQRVFPSRFNRRVTAQTPITISGPAAGSPLMRTVSDPAGTTVLGTLNNCAMGVTPWGTYLTCEENFNLYFVNHNADDQKQRPEHSRYRILFGKHAIYHQWDSIESRFDATPDATQPHQGHVNEPNRFGWVVEIDPFNPGSMPVKRTALGRFSHEGATVTLAQDGRVVVYSGDDSQGEYIYRFVSKGKFSASTTMGDNLLDEGTLYVAQFLADGSGHWLPLVFGEGKLTAANGIGSQAELLVKCRVAADLLQATPMDRPEWISIHPTTGEVYTSLTNNKERGKKFPVDAANPRQENLHGHIIRWKPAGSDHAADTFQWDIFLLAGVETPTQDLFSSPDSLWIDPNQRLWIGTDYDDASPAMQNMGCNQLLCADPSTRETRRFLTGPRGCEITGITMTPDCRTLWINVQDPDLHYPARDGKTRPRSTTVVITKNDGGVIGS